MRGEKWEWGAYWETAERNRCREIARSGSHPGDSGAELLHLECVITSQEEVNLAAHAANTHRKPSKEWLRKTELRFWSWFVVIGHLRGEPWIVRAKHRLWTHKRVHDCTLNQRARGRKVMLNLELFYQIRALGWVKRWSFKLSTIWWCVRSEEKFHDLIWWALLIWPPVSHVAALTPLLELSQEDLRFRKELLQQWEWTFFFYIKEMIECINIMIISLPW